LLLAWAALLLASVLVTHQHHVADIVGGALLGRLASGDRWWPRTRHRRADSA
jgi:membrane-associated phospholipid phosphatase